MKAVVQRVSSASVTISGSLRSTIGEGLVILLGIRKEDTDSDARYLAEKCAGLRIFEDREEKMNLSVRDVKGSVMVVSQFTLYGDARKGNRPSFTEAAPPDAAQPLYELFVQHMKTLVGNDKVATGVFREMMDISLVNSGPVTIILESKN